VLVAGLALFVTTIVGGSAALNWRNNPDALSAYADQQTLLHYTQPGVGATAVLVPGADSQERKHAVEVIGALPALQGDLSPGLVDVYACGHRKPKRATATALERHCALLPASTGDYDQFHTTLRLGGKKPDRLVLLVDGVEGERVQVDGVEVFYRDGWQEGSEVVGPQVVVRFGFESLLDYGPDGAW
jgi:hypothetical protein